MSIVKGISTIIAIIIILMIVVFLAALAYLWFTEIYTGLTETGQEQIEETTIRLGSSILIEGVKGDNIYVRNTGRYDIVEIVLYIDDVLTEATIPDKIEPGKVGTITLTTSITGEHRVKITSKYAETEGWFMFEIVEVIKEIPEINLAINGVEGDVTITEGTESNVTGWVEQGDAGAVTKLYKDDSLVSNPDVQTLSPGIYVYNFTYDETENFTSNWISRILNVTSVPSNIITVCKDGSCDSTTVQGGINLASSGKIVKITDGEIYNENVTITSDFITLDCNDATLQSLDPQRNIGINITNANSVNIENCNLKDYEVGIQTYISSENLIIVNNDIKGVYGMIFTNSNFDNINNNKITLYGEQFGGGIVLRNSNNNIVSNNNITGAMLTYCIYILDNSDYNQVISNNIEKCTDGMHILYSIGTEITSNVVCNNFGYDIICYGEEVTGSGNKADNVNCPGISYDPC